jgi:excisionase family DNA binding protein
MKLKDTVVERWEGAHLSKLAYRIDEATSVSGLGRTSIYEAIKTGALKSVYVSGRRLILRDDLEAFLRSGRDDTLEDNRRRLVSSAAQDRQFPSCPDGAPDC